jgi:hypothetical protein
MTSAELDLYRNRCYTMVVVQAPIERKRPTTAVAKYRHRDATFFVPTSRAAHLDSACVHTLSSNFHPLEVGTLSLIDGLAIDFLAGQPSRDDSYHFHLPSYLSCPSFLDL